MEFPANVFSIPRVLAESGELVSHSLERSGTCSANWTGIEGTGTRFINFIDIIVKWFSERRSIRFSCGIYWISSINRGKKRFWWCESSNIEDVWKRNVMLLLTIEKNEEREERDIASHNWKEWRKEKAICDCGLGRNEQKLREATRKKEASRYLFWAWAWFLFLAIFSLFAPCFLPGTPLCCSIFMLMS
jgi:hypothetical protein